MTNPSALPGWCVCGHRRRYHGLTGSCGVNVGKVRVSGWGPSVEDRTCSCEHYVNDPEPFRDEDDE